MSNETSRSTPPGPVGSYAYLALDPGRSCGWAAGSLVGDLQSGTLLLNGPMELRFGQLLRWLERHLPQKGIIVEQPWGLRGRQAQASVFGLTGVAAAVAEKYELAFNMYAPKQVKKYTGYGAATKHDMKQWAKLEHGIKVKTDDQADALALLCLHCMTKKRAGRITLDPDPPQQKRKR